LTPPQFTPYWVINLEQVSTDSIVNKAVSQVTIYGCTSVERPNNHYCADKEVPRCRRRYNNE